MIETPTYDLTNFKVRFGRLTLKAHSKGEHVLRVEAITHNTRDLGCGRVLDRWGEIPPAGSLGWLTGSAACWTVSMSGCYPTGSSTDSPHQARAASAGSISTTHASETPSLSSSL
ncbi:MAG: hypothetical protein OEW29_12705 [Acidimicrobiia bacterium]|nr:hypothetical protein [Acidimicrobiia bacterium]MDH4365418.1 hypothetical protein [Acidimicrobiia bacterium]